MSSRDRARVSMVRNRACTWIAASSSLNWRAGGAAASAASAASRSADRRFRSPRTFRKMQRPMTARARASIFPWSEPTRFAWLRRAL